MKLRVLSSDTTVVQCCVTSPPYWNLRDYGVPSQIGLEETPQAYVEKLVAVFREVRRILRDDGVLFYRVNFFTKKVHEIADSAVQL